MSAAEPYAEERLKFDELKDPSQSTVLVKKAGWKRLRVGNARYLAKAEKDPQKGLHRVAIHKIDPITKKKLATETIDAVPFGFDVMVAKDYIKYGLQQLRKKDLGKLVYAGKVESYTKSGAIRKAMERFLKGRRSH